MCWQTNGSAKWPTKAVFKDVFWATEAQVSTFSLTPKHLWIKKRWYRDCGTGIPWYMKQTYVHSMNVKLFRVCGVELRTNANNHAYTCTVTYGRVRHCWVAALLMTRTREGRTGFLSVILLSWRRWAPVRSSQILWSLRGRPKTILKLPQFFHMK